MLNQLGRVPINFVKVYSPSLVMRAHVDSGGRPELFFDIEQSGQRGVELHLGISANFKVVPWRDTSVKPHIDIYIPESEIPRIIEILKGDGL